MELLVPSGDLRLAGHLARPRTAPGKRVPGVVLAHGYPSGPRGGARSGRTLPELADRIATEMGWTALAFAFRGCGGSQGDFSLQGWLDDLLAAGRYLDAQPEVGGVWFAGFGTGGALAIRAGAADRRIRGVAALAAPADFDDWASHPRRLLQHAREQGIVTSEDEPRNFDRWARQLRNIRAVASVAGLAPRPLLVVHGAEDDLVPVFDARVVADAHGSADLRIIDGGEHQLRHDPRAVAVLLGWLDRQRNAAATAAAG